MVHIGSSGEGRTHNITGLSRLPLPVGLRNHGRSLWDLNPQFPPRTGASYSNKSGCCQFHLLQDCVIGVDSGIRTQHQRSHSPICYLYTISTILVWVVGFEPTTLGLEGRCSTPLSYTHMVCPAGFEPTTSCL